MILLSKLRNEAGIQRRVFSSSNDGFIRNLEEVSCSRIAISFLDLVPCGSTGLWTRNQLPWLGFGLILGGGEEIIIRKFSTRASFSVGLRQKNQIAAKPFSSRHICGT